MRSDLDGCSAEGILDEVFARLERLEKITEGMELMTVEALLQRTDYLKAELDKLKDLQPRSIDHLIGPG